MTSLQQQLNLSNEKNGSTSERGVVTIPVNATENLVLDKDDFNVVSSIFNNHGHGVRQDCPFGLDPKALKRAITKIEPDGDRRILGLMLIHIKNLWKDSTAVAGSSLIKKLEKLEELEIFSTHYCPEEIFDLTNLQSLSFAFPKFTSIPASIGRLKSLQHLSIHVVENLFHLPNEIWDLTNLRSLELFMSVSVPSSIGKLKNLKELSLGRDLGTIHFPVELWSLSSLEKLYLKNSLSLSSDICRLKNIKKLRLSHLNVTSLPPSIGKLTKLEELAVTHSPRLIALPDEVFHLSNLKLLDITDCPNITALPSSLGKLQNLRDLCFTHQEIPPLPILSKLTNLVILDLSESTCKSIPPYIDVLQNLEKLYLYASENISRLPEEIGNLSKLKFLDVSDTGITSLPESLKKLPGPFELNPNNHSDEYLLKLVTNCPGLVSLCEDENDNELLTYALACNRSKFITNFEATPPKLWPLVLKHGAKAFNRLRSFGTDDYWDKYNHYNLSDQDAIYRILQVGRGSFIHTLRQRRECSDWRPKKRLRLLED